jgi:5-methylcytosine-specific restriction endonuclease McrA
MKKHVKIYLDSAGKTTADVILCEIRAEGCESIAVDIHHINGRCGKNSDNIDNLVAVCRNCHNKAHGVDSKEIKRKLLGIVSRRHKYK